MKFLLHDPKTVAQQAEKHRYPYRECEGAPTLKATNTYPCPYCASPQQGFDITQIVCDTGKIFEGMKGDLLVCSCDSAMLRGMCTVCHTAYDLRIEEGEPVQFSPLPNGVWINWDKRLTEKLSKAEDCQVKQRVVSAYSVELHLGDNAYVPVWSGSYYVLAYSQEDAEEKAKEKYIEDTVKQIHIKTIRRLNTLDAVH